MARKFAEGTTVGAGATKGQIEDLLMNAGATQFGSMVDATRAMVMFAFGGLTYRISINLPDPDSDEFSTYYRGSVLYKREDHVARKLYADELNRRWRAIYAVIKAKLIAVSEGITSFEQEFLAYTLTANGETFGEYAIPRLQQGARDGNVPAALPMPGGGK